MRCCTHILTPVIADTIWVVMSVPLLNNLAVLIPESYQIINVWKKEPGHSPQTSLSYRRNTLVGQGCCSEEGLCILWQPTKYSVCGCNSHLDGYWRDGRSKANCTCQGQSINRVSAQGTTQSSLPKQFSLYLRIRPLSPRTFKPVAWTSWQRDGIGNTRGSAKECEGLDVERAANSFMQWSTDKLQEQDEDNELEVQAEMPQKRTKKRETMPWYHDRDTERVYKTKVHSVIMDTVTESICQRLLTPGTLYTDFTHLDPSRFSEIQYDAQTSLAKLSKLLLKFDNWAAVSTLQCELTSLASQGERLKTSAVEKYTTRTVRDTCRWTWWRISGDDEYKLFNM